MLASFCLPLFLVAYSTILSLCFRIHSDMKCPTNSQWLEKTVGILIEHLNRFGACVIDDFLGQPKGLDILDEVTGLQSAEVFREGQLASMSSGPHNQYRNDKITWTDGIDPPCPSIKHLIRYETDYSKLKYFTCSVQ